MVEQNNEIISARFNLIKSWVQKHLKTKNNLLSCNNKERKVFIYTLSGNRVVDIPVKKSNSDMSWASAWVDVYKMCLNALEEKVRFLCLHDSLVTHVSGSKIKVGERLIILPPEADEITYITALESIVNIYEEIKVSLKKKDEEKPIVVSCSTIQIDKPGDYVQSVSKVQSVSVETGDVSDSALVADLPNKVVGKKVSDNDLLKPMDCSCFREEEDPFVLITCTDLNKGDNVFIHNADLCKHENVPIGAFISGKAITKDQVSNEMKKMNRLFEDYKLKGPVVYEINNDYIRKNRSDHGKIILALDMVSDIANGLRAKKFNPIICVDADTHKIITDVNKKIRPNFKFGYPIILRILPREKDEIDDSYSTVLMDPIYDYDIVTINNPNFSIA